MNKLPFLLAFALGAIVGAVVVGGVSSRWYFTAEPSGLIIRGDKWTGEAWYALVRDRLWVRIRHELSDVEVFKEATPFAPNQPLEAAPKATKQ